MKWAIRSQAPKEMLMYFYGEGSTTKWLWVICKANCLRYSLAPCCNSNRNSPKGGVGWP